MSEDEFVFKDVCALLRQHNVNYWVCHGTLLGIIREGRLLPWDHDIDFAVWDFEVSKELIISIFVDAGYEQELVFGDMDCLHFYGKSKKIDVSFYKKDNNTAFIKWVAPSESAFMKACIDCVQIICTDYDIKKIELAVSGFKRLTHISLIQVSRMIKRLLTSKAKEFMYHSLVKRLNYKGYSYPYSLMEFKDIKYNDFLISVPVDSKKCLEITYGEDWAIPKKNYIWYEEAKNLVDLKGV